MQCRASATSNNHHLLTCRDCRHLRRVDYREYFNSPADQGRDSKSMAPPHDRRHEARRSEILRPALQCLHDPRRRSLSISAHPTDSSARLSRPPSQDPALRVDRQADSPVRTPVSARHSTTSETRLEHRSTEIFEQRRARTGYSASAVRKSKILMKATRLKAGNIDQRWQSAPGRISSSDEAHRRTGNAFRRRSKPVMVPQEHCLEPESSATVLPRGPSRCSPWVRAETL